MQTVRSFQQDALRVHIYETRAAMGAAAAQDGANLLRTLLATQEEVRVVFAAAPSQNEFLEALCQAPGIDWPRVKAFHMDEYVGLDPTAPQGFGNFLRKRIFGRLPFGLVEYLDGNAADPQAECARYGALLAAAPIDIVFLGIGENGHIAFNDPPVAQFDDPAAVKVVKLDEVCRNQQVHDGCFERLDDVPKYAITLTVPALTQATAQICVVPAATNAAAVRAAVFGPIGNECPASVLRLCRDARLYLDADSSALLDPA